MVNSFAKAAAAGVVGEEVAWGRRSRHVGAGSSSSSPSSEPLSSVILASGSRLFRWSMSVRSFCSSWTTACSVCSMPASAMCVLCHSLTHTNWIKKRRGRAGRPVSKTLSGKCGIAPTPSRRLTFQFFVCARPTDPPHDESPLPGSGRGEIRL